MMGPLPLPLPLPILCILFSVDLVTARSLLCRPCTTALPSSHTALPPLQCGGGLGRAGEGAISERAASGAQHIATLTS